MIIIGTGRCGSTLLHRVLARHDELGWLSSFNEALPAHTWLSAFSGLYGSPLPERVKELRGFPKPFEAYRFWEHHLPGFSRRDRPPGADDVPASGIEPVRAATASVLRFQRRDRLLVKITGWSRIAYFDRIYPNAVFVSLRRDPRAVASSWMKKSKKGHLDVTLGSPDRNDWQWGEVRPGLYEAWRELGGGQLLSIALKIRLDVEDITRNMGLFPERCHEISYEELIARPEEELRSICEFAGLAWTPRFERVVDGLSLYDPSDKWKRHLTEQEGELMLEFFRRADAPATEPPPVTREAR